MAIDFLEALLYNDCKHYTSRFFEQIALRKRQNFCIRRVDCRPLTGWLSGSGVDTNPYFCIHLFSLWFQELPCVLKLSRTQCWKVRREIPNCFPASWTKFYGSANDTQSAGSLRVNHSRIHAFALPATALLRAGCLDCFVATLQTVSKLHARHQCAQRKILKQSIF